MPAEFIPDDANRLITIKWHGDIVFADLMQSLDRYMRGVRGNGSYRHYDEILDLTDGQGLLLTFNDLKLLGEFAVGFDEFENTALAIIAKSRVAYYMAYAYAVIRRLDRRSLKTVRVFDDLQAAVDWLQYRDRSAAQLMQANGLNGDTLQIGQVLRIPSRGS